MKKSTRTPIVKATSKPSINVLVTPLPNSPEPSPEQDNFEINDGQESSPEESFGLFRPRLYLIPLSE
jgi:hypothetical protein